MMSLCRNLSISIFVLFALLRNLPGQAIWFTEDFSSGEYTNRWHAVAGDWVFEDGHLTIETAGFDELLAAETYVYNTTPYTIESTFRGPRPGIYFCLDDTASKNLSHLVRFEGTQLLAGIFNAAGVFEATAAFTLPQPPDDWIRLRLDIMPSAARYVIFVDNDSIGTVPMFRLTSGFVGLQASAGISSFRNVTIRGKRPPKPPEAPKKGEIISFQHLRYVHSQGDNLVIYNPQLRLRQTIDSQGRLLEQEAVRTTARLRPGTFHNGKIYSIQGEQVSITDVLNKHDSVISEGLIAPHQLLVDPDGNLFVADPGARAIFKFDPKGHLKKSFQARSVGGLLAPRGIDFYGDSLLVIADNDRLIFVGRDLKDVQPRITFPKTGEAIIAWSRHTNKPAVLDYAPDGDGWTRQAGSLNSSGNYEVRLTGLTPFQRYSFTFAPALKTIPGIDKHSSEFRMTVPAVDQTSIIFTRLPIMALVYRTVSTRDRYPATDFPSVPDGRTLGDDELRTLKDALQFNREFYFRNSACRFVLDFDTFIVEDTLWLAEIGAGETYWLEPGDRVVSDFERAAAHFGKPPESYAGFIAPYAWVNYPPGEPGNGMPADSVIIRQAHAGGTYSVPAPWRYGTRMGYTAIPIPEHPNRLDWLITHEFHHQLDALMEQSGYRDYYHADQPWKMSGRFGEDFDFNALIIRAATEMQFVNLKFGKVSTAKDADGDGLPDDDPSLPFDELRLAGDAASSDTDGDGLPDLAEFMAGTASGTRLDNPDSDGDGLIDGEDPEPLYFVNQQRPYSQILREFPTTELVELAHDSLRATIFLDWTEDTLVVGYRATRPANLLLQIDANGDGWFHGFDNLQIRISTNGDSAAVVDYYLRDCSSWLNPPEDRKDVLNPEDLVIRAGNNPIPNDPGHKLSHTLSAKIPALPSYGLAFSSGESLALRIGLQTQNDRWIWYEAFERNYMIPLQLQ